MLLEITLNWNTYKHFVAGIKRNWIWNRSFEHLCMCTQCTYTCCWIPYNRCQSNQFRLLKCLVLVNSLPKCLWSLVRAPKKVDGTSVYVREPVFDFIGMCISIGWVYWDTDLNTIEYLWQSQRKFPWYQHTSSVPFSPVFPPKWKKKLYIQFMSFQYALSKQRKFCACLEFSTISMWAQNKIM